MNNSTKANLYLLLITAIWGTTFPLIRTAMAHVDPNVFVAARFLIAAILLLFFMSNELKLTTRKILFHSLVLGTCNGIAYTAQTIGLQTIHASRSAFITGASVLLVPFLAPLFRQGRLRAIDVVCSVLCLLGIYILTGADLSEITIGDKWTFLCAIMFALQITYLQFLSQKIKYYKLLTFYQLLFTTPIAFFFAPISGYANLAYSSVIIALIFCALFATALAFSLQTKYQRFTTAPKAALIFSLEPVFASFFGYVLNGEAITRNIAIGGFIILISLITPDVMALRRRA